MILHSGLEYGVLLVDELRTSMEIAERLQHIEKDVIAEELMDVRMSILYDSDDVNQTHPQYTLSLRTVSHR